MRMRFLSTALGVCSVTTFAMALKFVDRVPDFAGGLLFGISVGFVVVLYALSIHGRWPKRRRPLTAPRC